MAKTETASNVKLHILELSERLQSEITLDKKTGVGTVAEGTYERLLPGGIDMDTVKKINEHNQAMVAAGTHALGVVSIPVMKKDNDLGRTTLVIPTVGKDYMGFAFDRSREVRAPGSDTPVTKFGSTTQEIVTYGTKNRGDLAKVKSELAEMALDAFGSKK